MDLIALGAGALAVIFGAQAIRLAQASKSLRTRCTSAEKSCMELALAKEQADHLVQDLTKQRADQSNELHALRTKYDPLIHLDGALEKSRQEFAAAQAHQAEIAKRYAEAKLIYDQLVNEVALVEETAEAISVGIYKPHFDFSTPAIYKERLTDVYLRRKAMVNVNTAIVYGTEWLVNNNKKEGERMQRQYGSLMLRAFNGECEAITAKVTWSNALRMEERIKKAFTTINKFAGVMMATITDRYMQLWLEELHLTHEMAEKKRAIQDEQRLLKAKMREEEKAQREIEREKVKAEDEATRYEKALALAREALESASESEVAQLNERLQELEAQLVEALHKKERAIARAQTTRSGHVYIISNVGSFGEDIVKIGMTRRLEPLERVKELGDASVPFGFDIHGLIWSEDAPTLEYELHAHFGSRRVNLANERKEFFRVRPDEVGDFLRSKGLEAELTLLAEAREHRETLALAAQSATVASTNGDSTPTFPQSL
ncbi:MAG: DUF4041 domain-containing protein [bacterium]